MHLLARNIEKIDYRLLRVDLLFELDDRDELLLLPDVDDARDELLDERTEVDLEDRPERFEDERLG